MVAVCSSRVFLALTHFALALAILPADYQTLSALEKQNLLWNQFRSNPYPDSSLPQGGLTPLDLASLVQAHYYIPSFNRTSDEMPEGRRKLFHPYGSCAKANFEILPDSPYTGVFQAGSINAAIIRPSIAAWNPATLTPGLGIKVLIDGAPSQNFHLLFTLEGQGSNNNYFYNAVSNTFIQPPPTGGLAVVTKALEDALVLISGGFIDLRPVSSTVLGLYEQASVQANGHRVSAGAVKAPFKLEFIPNSEFGVPADSTDDFRVQLSRVPVGSILYTVVAHASPSDWESGVKGQLLGRVVLTSELIATKYCDETLFMQHAKLPWKPSQI